MHFNFEQKTTQKKCIEKSLQVKSRHKSKIEMQEKMKSKIIHCFSETFFFLAIRDVVELTHLNLTLNLI